MSWSDTARGQAGVITRAQLRAFGLCDRTVTRMVASRALDRQAPGVFLVRGAPRSHLTAVWSTLLCTGGVLGFGSAANMWGFVPRPDRVHVVVPESRRPGRPPGAQVHRVFVPVNATTTHRGVPMTTPTWSLLDHLGDLDHSSAVRLADRALQRGWFTVADLSRRLTEYPYRRGNGRLRAVASVVGDGAAAQSERVLHRLLRRAAIDGWHANHPVRAQGSLIAVVDVAFPERLLAVEVDGWAYHSDVDRFQRDRRRQNALTSMGWTVLRFTWADLTERPEYVIGTIRFHLRTSGD